MMKLPKAAVLAVSLALALVGCATQKPYDSIRLTIHESEVAPCEQRGTVSVTTDTVGVSILPMLGPGGEDAPVDKELPRMDPRAVESLQYLASKKGGDTILLTTIQPSSAKGTVYRCR